MTVETSSATPASPLAPHSRRWSVGVPLVVSVLALSIAGWQWFESRQVLHSAQTELARKLSDQLNANQALKAQAEQTQQAIQSLTARLGTMETRVNEAAGQFATIQNMYQELNHSRDDWKLAEIEHALTIATQQLQLAGNIPAAITALSLLDERLNQQEQPQFIALRKVISQDLQTLRALPHVDKVGLTVKLDRLAYAVDSLPLQIDIERTQPSHSPVAKAEQGDGFTAYLSPFLQQLWSEFARLVRVRHLDQPDALLLTPEQSYFLRENLRLQLLDARLAVLQGEENHFRTTLSAVEQHVRRHFDTRSEKVATWLTSCVELQQSPVAVVVPDLANSLNAVRAAQGSTQNRPVAPVTPAQEGA